MDRFNASFEQWESFQEGKANAGDALRLTYWSRTIEDLKSDDLLIGRGTGSYRFVNGRSKHSLMHEALLPTDNPHNEFLMILSQQGLIGLGMLLVIGILHWRVSSLSPANMQWHVKGLLMVFGFGCLFNCMLLDNLEGHFYVLMVVAFGAVPRHYRAMSD
jgi:O-antigen ligase